MEDCCWPSITCWVPKVISKLLIFCWIGVKLIDETWLCRSVLKIEINNASKIFLNVILVIWLFSAPVILYRSERAFLIVVVFCPPG